MKLIAEFVCDNKYVVKEKSYGERMCLVEFTPDLMERANKLGVDSDYIASHIAREIEGILFNAEFHPTARDTCGCWDSNDGKSHLICAKHAD